MRTAVRMPGQAGVAVATGACGLQRHAVTHGQCRDSLAKQGDFSGWLMAQHEGERHDGITNAAVHIIMDIAAADADGAQAHQYLSGPGAGTGASVNAICPTAVSWAERMVVGSVDDCTDCWIAIVT